MSSYFDINEGKTGSNGFLATVFGFVGIVLLTVSLPFSILSFVFCIFFAQMTEGLEIKIASREYRKYFDLFGLRIGSWRKMIYIESVELIPKIRKTRVRRWLPRNVSYSERVPYNETTLTYELKFKGKEEFVNFYEFNEYKNAHKTLEFFRKQMNIPVVDRFTEN